MAIARINTNDFNSTCSFLGYAFRVFRLCISKVQKNLIASVNFSPYGFPKFDAKAKMLEKPFRKPKNSEESS